MNDYTLEPRVIAVPSMRGAREEAVLVEKFRQLAPRGTRALTLTLAV